MAVGDCAYLENTSFIEMLVVLAAEALFWRGRVHVDGEKPVGLRMCSQSQEWSNAHLPLCGPEILELQEDALIR